MLNGVVLHSRLLSSLAIATYMGRRSAGNTIVNLGSPGIFVQNQTDMKTAVSPASPLVNLWLTGLGGHQAERG